MRLFGSLKRLLIRMTTHRDLNLDDFCRAIFPSLVGMLSLWCDDRYLAQELAQETLARVCRDWGKVKSLDHPEAWARRVALNLALSWFRRRKAERRALSLSHKTQQRSQPDSAAAVELRTLIGALPKRQRTAVVLRYYSDLSFAEIGAVMEVPESTAKSLVTRSIKRLRDAEFRNEEASDAR